MNKDEPVTGNPGDVLTLDCKWEKKLSITKAELINHLDQFPDDMEVFYSKSPDGLLAIKVAELDGWGVDGNKRYYIILRDLRWNEK